MEICPGSYEPRRPEATLLSPDDRQVAVTVLGAGPSRGIWTLELARGVATKVTPGGWNVGAPLWSPDGGELYFQSNHMDDNITRPYHKRLDSAAPPTLLLDSERQAFVEDVSPDGTTLLILAGLPPRNDRIGTLSLNQGGEVEPLTEVDYTIDGHEISPDGRWLAYVSDQTGEFEVYVAPSRRDGPTLRVSPAGGRQPQWRGDGRELFYVTEGGELMAVAVDDGGSVLSVGEPSRLFRAGVSSFCHDHYDATRDGQRFLVMTPAEGSGAKVRILLNWQSLLE